MFEFPGFDPHSMSDDELADRSMELSRRIAWASRFGGSEMLGTYLMFRNAIQAAQRERMLRPALEARAAMPAIMVETDPDLAIENKLAQEEETAKNTPKAPPRARPYSITRDRIKPTAKPVSPDDTI